MKEMRPGWPADATEPVVEVGFVLHLAGAAVGRGGRMARVGRFGGGGLTPGRGWGATRPGCGLLCGVGVAHVE